jgi:hypothetical protein
MVKSRPDKELERRRFNALYKYVDAKLDKYCDTYDFREDWVEYLLFMMIPRADALYEGFEELDYLFPYPKVKRGSNVIVYCMGTYGQRLYGYLKQSNFCKVAALADRNYKELRKQGFPVIAPEEISNYEYDAIVIASSFAKTRKAIYKDLTSKYPVEKVHIMDEELVKSEESGKRFGLT